MKIDILQRGRQLLFRDLQLEFPTGLTLLLGPNGVGKSTLLEQLAALRSSAAIHTALDGQPGQRAILAKVGSLAQRDPLIPAFKVKEFLEYSAWLKGVSPKDVIAAAASIATRFEVEGLLKTQIGRLSGGQKQRVAAAASVVHQPDVWLLDEPFNDLDPEQRAFLARRIEDYALNHVVIVSTHLLAEIHTRAAQCIVLNKRSEISRVIFSGSEDALRATANGSLELAYARLVEGSS